MSKPPLSDKWRACRWNRPFTQGGEFPAEFGLGRDGVRLGWKELVGRVVCCREVRMESREIGKLDKVVINRIGICICG